MFQNVTYKPDVFLSLLEEVAVGKDNSNTLAKRLLAQIEQSQNEISEMEAISKQV